MWLLGVAAGGPAGAAAGGPVGAAGGVAAGEMAPEQTKQHEAGFQPPSNVSHFEQHKVILTGELGGVLSLYISIGLETCLWYI